ncbi:MAG: MFS transporter [Pseudomonadota bacterium]
MTRPRTGGAYAVYALLVLMVAYVTAFVDRQILNLLVEPIKRDTGLGDTGISLLQGLSFALFLSVGGLPIGRLIDTRRRVTILGLGIACWSLFTGCFGLTRNYVIMLLSRVGVGVGEATMTPSAYSLLGDYFSPRRLGVAVGVYAMGSYIGSGLALILGSTILSMLPHGEVALPRLGNVRDWQAIFLLLFPVGLLVALWVATLKEPARRSIGDDAVPPLSEVWRYGRAHWRAILGVDLAVGFTNMAAYGLLSWAPALMGRAFHLAPAQAGWRLGLVIISACCCGTVVAGLTGDALRKRGLATGRLVVMLTSACCAAPFAIMAPLASGPTDFLALAFGLLFFLAAALGSGPATLQEITPNRMRGMQHAVAVLLANLLGIGIGPTAVALITDQVFHRPSGLPMAMAIALPVMLVGAAGMNVIALRHYGRALRANDQTDVASRC